MGFVAPLVVVIAMAAVYAIAAFAIVYFAVRLAIRHERETSN